MAGPGRPERPADDDARLAWLLAHSSGAERGDALAFFDACPAAAPDDLTGRWRGRGLPTGSRLDGLLEAYGWYGKEFVDQETVHPLLFRDGAGRPRPLDPALAPVGLLVRHPRLFRSQPARTAFAAGRSLRWTRRPAARIRMLEHRGVVTAAMIYDALPIVDVVRRVAADTLLGVMDLRGLDEPFFFVLERDGPGQPSR